MSLFIEEQELLARLIHDLRQPLGTIETSAYVLNRVLDPAHAKVCEQVRVIERQADRAASLLKDAAGELRRLRAQRGGMAESLDLTKAETAAVT